MEAASFPFLFLSHQISYELWFIELFEIYFQLVVYCQFLVVEVCMPLSSYSFFMEYNHLVGHFQYFKTLINISVLRSFLHMV